MSKWSSSSSMYALAFNADLANAIINAMKITAIITNAIIVNVLHMTGLTQQFAKVLSVTHGYLG